MATWQDLSLESLSGAQSLLTAGYLRSSVSRSYYAAYSALSEELSLRGVQFAHGWNNPSHEQLPALIRNGLALRPNTRRQLVRAIRRLRVAREDADYRPGTWIGRPIALACLHDAVVILQALGISDG